MPNTLVHLGVQGLASRSIAPDVDLRIVYLACVVPDVPWILQRAAITLAPDVDRAELMLRGGVQSSLLFCLILSASLALTMRRSLAAFTVLAIGSLFHLLLDITQIKWGRGAILFAPFDWQLVSLDWAWPENPIFQLATIASLGFVVLTWRSVDHREVLRGWSAKRHLAALGLLAVYAAAPAYLTGELLAADVYYSQTLSDSTDRTGKPVAFDRAPISVNGEGIAEVELYTGERLHITGVDPREGSLVSVRGIFSGEKTIRADEAHFHPPHTRIAASIAGLALVLAIWMQSFFVWYLRRS